MANSGVCQIDQDLSRARVGHVKLDHFGRDFAWLVIDNSLVLLGELYGSHYRLLLSARTMYAVYNGRRAVVAGRTESSDLACDFRAVENETDIDECCTTSTAPRTYMQLAGPRCVDPLRNSRSSGGTATERGSVLWRRPQTERPRKSRCALAHDRLKRH